MTRSAKTSLAHKALQVTGFISIVLLIVLLVFIYVSERQALPGDRLEYYKLYLAAFQLILIGFGVALLGTLVPAIFSEARHNFERLKESRTAYSEAKTGMDYLTLRLCTLSVKEGAALVQSVHVRKHQAELYDELRHWLERRFDANDPKRDPVKWGDDMYDKLFAIRTLLEKHVESWDDLKQGQRLALLNTIQPSKKEI